MKTHLIAFLLFSFSAYAQEVTSFTVTNKGNSEQTLQVSCDDSECGSLVVRSLERGEVLSEVSLTYQDLQDLSESEVALKLKNKDDMSPYSLTKMAIDSVKDAREEGSTGKVVLRSALSVAAAGVDTALLPVTFLVSLVTKNLHVSGMSERSASRKLMSLINEGKDIVLTKKQYRRLVKLFSMEWVFRF